LKNKIQGFKRKVDSELSTIAYLLAMRIKKLYNRNRQGKKVGGILLQGRGLIGRVESEVNK
jgi:hypothetical protein